MEARRATTTLAAPTTQTTRAGRAGRGSPTGGPFADAVDQHHQSVTRFAYVMCGNVTQAEDAVAEAYARVWRRWRRGHIDNLYGYLRRSVANEIYGRHRHLRLERREAERPREPSDGGEFETRLGDRDVLWTALAHLSPATADRRGAAHRRGPLRGRDRRHARHPPGTVKSWLSRALSILRAAVEGERG